MSQGENKAPSSKEAMGHPMKHRHSTGSASRMCPHCADHSPSAAWQACRGKGTVHAWVGQDEGSARGIHAGAAVVKHLAHRQHQRIHSLKRHLQLAQRQQHVRQCLGGVVGATADLQVVVQHRCPSPQERDHLRHPPRVMHVNRTTLVACI